MQNDSFESKIEYLKKCISEMLAERDAIAARNSTALPTPMWSEAVRIFNYLVDLPPQHFRNIRFHASLINGISFTFWLPYPKPNPEYVASKTGYLRAIRDVPEKYWASEPPTPGIPRPISIDYKGHMINGEVGRYQQCISSLYHSGAWSFVADSAVKRLIVEVGGGYGGLAHYIGNITGEKATYVLVDLPETLLFSGAFLMLNNPTKAIYIWNKNTFNPRSLSQYDFALLPNFALEQLSAAGEVAIMINTWSFQEMSEAQLEEYLEFAHEKVNYCVYSDNMDRHPHNESPISVSKLMQKYFTLQPSPEYYDKAYRGIDPLSFTCRRQFLGFPKNSNIGYKKVPNFPYVPETPELGLLAKLIPSMIRARIPRQIKRIYG